VLVASEILIAISGLSDALQFTNSDKAFLDTPKSFAASVIVIPRGFKTSSKNTSPGCVGYLLFNMKSLSI